jgi:hypothetical protein
MTDDRNTVLHLDRARILPWCDTNYIAVVSGIDGILDSLEWVVGCAVPDRSI